MHNRNQPTRRSALRGGTARPASPAVTRSRAAALLEGAPPSLAEEADDQAANTNPPEAGGGAATADSVDSFDGSESDADFDADADDAAADAAASRRRTEARLEELEEAQPALSPGHAALQFAARGVELLGNPPTASVETSGALVGPPNPDLGTLGASRDEGSVAPVPVFRGLPARTPRGGALGPSTWTPQQQLHNFGRDTAVSPHCADKGGLSVQAPSRKFSRHI